MSEEAIKHQERRLTNTVLAYFSKLFKPEEIYFLNGDPFKLEFSDPGTGLTYKICIVIGKISQKDRDAVANRPLNPILFRKYIACRPADNDKDFDLIQIK